MKENLPLLGVFDSGVGGFSIFREIRKVTSSDIVYFGDCLHAPYGNKSEEEIVGYITEILLLLQGKGVTHFVSACNSMSVLTTKKLLHSLSIQEEKYIDMVSAVRDIVFLPSSHVVIIGTRATIASSVYQNILKEEGISYDVFVPESLALYIENDDVEGITNEINRVLSFVEEVQGTTVLYACTHYPLVDDLFKAMASKRSLFVTFVNPAYIVAEKVKALMLEGEGKSIFEASLATDVFKKYVCDSMGI